VIAYEGVNVQVTQGRWDATLVVTNPAGEVMTTLIFSADSYLADSGIWVGTPEEYEATL